MISDTYLTGYDELPEYFKRESMYEGTYIPDYSMTALDSKVFLNGVFIKDLYHHQAAVNYIKRMMPNP